MDAGRRFQLTSSALFAGTLAHAAWTWPVRDALALFAGGVAVAFVLEVLGVRSGLLRHALRPRVASVPVSVLLAWPSVVYAAYRLALLVAPAGTGSAALAALLATGFDLLADPVGVREGLWVYPDTPVSVPRFRGVPWWNFVAWLAVVFVTARLPDLAGG